jgi:Ran GTPase-activating protein (RanGAP) involved in mRNA processing and transport
MTIKYNLGQQFVVSVSVLLISLFLQSCNQFSNPLIPIIEEAQGSGDDNQQLDSQDSLKEVEDKNLITQGGNQKDIQKIVTNNNATTQVDVSIIDKEKKSHQILGKRLQPEEIINNISQPFELNATTPADSQEAGIQKCRKLTHLNLGTKQSERAVLLNQGRLIGGVKKITKTKQEPTKIKAVLGSFFDILPRDLLPGILSYLGSKEMGQVRQLSRGIYKLTTGYERPGMVGVESKPSTNGLVLRLNTCTVDFKKVEGLTPKTISSFAFYQLMGKVRNLPSIFWAHIKGTSIQTIYLESNQIDDSGAVELAKNLQGTSIHTINLGGNQIDNSGAAEFAKTLQGSSVHTVNLWGNQIGASGAAELAKNLKGTSVHTVYLNDNKIGDSGAAELAKNLQGTSVYTIYLGWNQIGDSGAAELAKNLQGTSVHTIYLGGNQIGSSGAAELAKNLKGTSVHTINLYSNQIGGSGAAELAKNLKGTSVHTIDLSDNQIGDSRAAELAKNLQGTSVHTVNLHDNQIGDSGAAELAQNLQGTSVHTIDLRNNKIGDSGAAELVKNLKGTSVHTIDLGYNQIGSLGAAELAKNLKGTSVHTIYLFHNKIGFATQDLLKRQYTHIQWTF